MAQRILGLKTFQLGARSGSKDSHDRESARSVPHRPLGQDRQVADNGVGRIEQRNAAIALDTPPFKTGVGGEELADTFGMISGLAVQDCFARSPVEGDFEVFLEASASPDGTRPKPRTISEELRNEGVLAFECGCEVSDERVEKPIAGFRLHPFDDLAQRRVVGRGLGSELLRTHQREVSLDSPGLVTHRF